MPFLAKLIKDGIAPERIIPVTRAGAAAWYGVPQGLEIYALRTPQDMRIENRAQQMRWGLVKQTHETAWDRALMTDAAAALRLTSYQTLHPAWMYQQLMPFWKGEKGPAYLNQYATFGELPPPALPDGITLPEEFVAVKFYSRYTFPHSPDVQQFVVQTVKQIAKTHPVVLLDWNEHVDDHQDFDVPDLPNVIRLSTLRPKLGVETALALQAAVLARSMGFVGTYGGFAHLALRFRRPVVSYYWEWGAVAFAHRTLSEQLAQSMLIPFHCLRVLDLAMIQTVAPNVMLTKPSAEPTQLQTL